jgi:hypothetical protein
MHRVLEGDQPFSSRKFQPIFIFIPGVSSSGFSLNRLALLASVLPPYKKKNKYILNDIFIIVRNYF